ncbi:hypothetical protein KEM56_002174 [Ascosphaera pollenicola]|nr:hypothetical protein KEM56_002174 [Ascosphaera pollenicola]
MEDISAYSDESLSVTETSTIASASDLIQFAVGSILKNAISNSSPAPANNGVSEYFFRDYQDYESRLVFYIVHTANRFIYASVAWRDESAECSPPFPTTINGFIESCEASLEDLLSAAELIAAKEEAIPDFAMLILKKVIDMRERMQSVYLNFLKKNMVCSEKQAIACIRVAQKPHWHVMSYLKQIWFTWDGDIWLASREERYGSETELSRLKADDKLLSNLELLDAVRFNIEKDEMPGDAANQDGRISKRQPNAGNIKLSKDGTGLAQKRLEIVWKVDIHKLQQLSQEAMEEFGLNFLEIRCQTKYHMAYVCLVQQANEARVAMIDTWHLAAEGKIPLVVAGLVAQIGIETVGYHEAAMNKLICLGTSLYSLMTKVIRIREDIPLADKFTSPWGHCFTTEDILMGQTFHTLYEFIVDYRVFRLGRPTQAMLDSFVTPFNPDAWLADMEKHEKDAWLRTWTIKWLYDFMNSYITGINEYLAENPRPATGQTGLFRCVIDGPATSRRRMLGFNEFAYQLVDIIFDKELQPVDRILFREVFQLQCILDALLVTRGWQSRPTEGHEFKESKTSDPVRDLESFFGWTHINGFGPSFADARRTFFDESTRHPKQEGRLAKESLALCQQIIPTFNIIGDSAWLPSPSIVNIPDDIWSGCPFLCGTALSEALTIGSRVGHIILDRHTEVVAYAHLQRMLLKKGLMSRETGLYEAIRSVFETDLFSPEALLSGFKASLDRIIEQVTGIKSDEFYENTSRNITGEGLVVDWKECNIYNMNTWARSYLLRPTLYGAYAGAEYIPDAVTFHALTYSSYLRALKTATRAISGLEPEMQPGSDDADPNIMELLKGFYTPNNAGKEPADLPFAWSRPDIGNILYRLRCDLLSDGAFSSYLNYPRIIADMLNFFHELDAELRKEDNSSLVMIDEGMMRDDQVCERFNRFHLTSYILELADAGKENGSERDKRLFELVTQVMERCSSERTDDYFYHGLEPSTLRRMRKEQMLEDRRFTPECTML